MQNVFESVQSNKQRSLFVVVFFVIFILISSVFISRGMAAYYGYESTGLEFIGIALIISGVSSVGSYFFSDKIILAMSGARLADKKKDYLFYTVTENMCLASGLPMPKLYVIEDTAMNAFATGRNPQNAAICATSGLLEKLNRTELEGVVAHELGHVGNYDILLMSLVTVLVGVITLLGDWFLRSTFRSRSRDGDDDKSGVIFFAIGMLFALLSPIVAQLIQLAISRRREFLADATSAKITRQPSGLISALKKISNDKEPLEAANKATAHLYIVNPLLNLESGGQVGWFANLFNTHPPVEERIKVLEKMM